MKKRLFETEKGEKLIRQRKKTDSCHIAGKYIHIPHGEKKQDKDTERPTCFENKDRRRMCERHN